MIGVRGSATSSVMSMICNANAPPGQSRTWRLGIEYGVYGDLTIMYPKPYSIYLRGAINLSLLRR